MWSAWNMTENHENRHRDIKPFEIHDYAIRLRGSKCAAKLNSTKLILPLFAANPRLSNGLVDFNKTGSEHLNIRFAEKFSSIASIALLSLLVLILILRVKVDIDQLGLKGDQALIT